MRPTTTVEEATRHCPAAIRVFVRHGMACVGCPMARFDTIADSAAVYGLDPDALVDELRRAMEPAGAASPP